MRMIQEYPLVFNTQPQTFSIQGFDEVLKVGLNPTGNMSVWVSADPNASGQPTQITFQMVEAGQPVPNIGTYIGSDTIKPDPLQGTEHTMFVWSS
jgi:hypothetical protein